MTNKLTPEQEEFLDDSCDGPANWTIDQNTGLVDVLGGIFMRYNSQTQLPVEFGVVQGNFDCSNNNLLTLKGCPKVVTGRFECQANNLTSLEYCPESIDGGIRCGFNPFVPTKELFQTLAKHDVLDRDIVMAQLKLGFHRHYGLTKGNPLIKALWKEITGTEY